MHYDGPNGNNGYAYEVRVAGKSSADPPVASEVSAQT